MPINQLQLTDNPLLFSAVSKAQNLLLSQQNPEGYWWFTLEANDSINAEAILLKRYLNLIEPLEEKRLARHLEASQRADGSWPLYEGGAGDLSTTVECYWALKIAGVGVDSPGMQKAVAFIKSQGGISKIRIFTRIHLALFGLVPWEVCPQMPISFIHLPVSFPVNIYEFSSWARACIVPLLVLMEQKKQATLNSNFLDELYCEDSKDKVDWSYPKLNGGFWETFFINTDRILSFIEKKKWKLPGCESALAKCEAWIREHVILTEDIYPALAYSAMALHALGRPKSDPVLQKCLKALKSFQMPGGGNLEAIVDPKQSTTHLYQQCCISPVWDTPWSSIALLESGLANNHPALQTTARWLLKKQILYTYGDWVHKNPKTLPGGWSFEFQNDFFPDVDDTLEVLMVLHRVELPSEETMTARARGLNWLLSMQSDNGGWAAFDRNNQKEFLNKIPFSDHGACLDPPTPDITGRMLEFLALEGYTIKDMAARKAIRFIERTQEKNGPWWGRWGINYLYGTWCVLQGLKAIGYDMKSASIQKALNWMESVQNSDGGFGESPESYPQKKFVPAGHSVASQTAWALMGLIAGGRAKSVAATKALNWLLENQNASGSWDEKDYTGTGFPGHFYIRYHGYRHYFPLLALGKYAASIT